MSRISTSLSDLRPLRDALHQAPADGIKPKTPNPVGGFVRCNYPYFENWPMFAGLKSRPALVIEHNRHRLGFEYVLVLFCGTSSFNNKHLRWNVIDLAGMSTGLTGGKKTIMPDGTIKEVNYLRKDNAALLPVTKEFFPKGLSLIGSVSPKQCKSIMGEFNTVREAGMAHVNTRPYRRAKFIREQLQAAAGRPIMIWVPPEDRRELFYSKNRDGRPVPRWIVSAP